MKKLELKFKNEEGKLVTISLDEPVELVDSVAVNAAMDEIITQNIFFSAGGNLVSKDSVRIVDRTVQEIQL